MSDPFKGFNKLRVMEDKDGLIYIQELKFGLIWWTIFKTYHHKAAKSFLDFTGKEYNMVTGYYE